MQTIKFRGMTVKYDEKVFKSWKVQRRIAREGQMAVFDIADELLYGKADEIAEKLDDDVDAMGELLTAIANEVAEAKN